MAAPHVSGCCALLVEWWRLHSAEPPSAALLKAFLVNGAVDLAGGDDGKGGVLGPIPNNDQGWGRVSMANMPRSREAAGDRSWSSTRRRS